MDGTTQNGTMDFISQCMSQVLTSEAGEAVRVTFSVKDGTVRFMLWTQSENAMEVAKKICTESHHATLVSEEEYHDYGQNEPDYYAHFIAHRPKEAYDSTHNA